MEPITGAVAGLIAGTAAGWIARGLLGRDAQRAIEDAKERLSEAVKADVAGAIRDNSEVLVGLADGNFKKTMAAAKGELDRKHQLFEGLVKPLSSGYEKLNPQIEQLARAPRPTRLPRRTRSTGTPRGRSGNSTTSPRGTTEPA